MRPRVGGGRARPGPQEEGSARGSVVSPEAEGKEEPHPGAAVGSVLCGLTRLALRTRGRCPSAQRPRGARRDSQEAPAGKCSSCCRGEMRVTVRMEGIRELFGLCGPEVFVGLRRGVKGEELPALLGFWLVWLAG